MAQVMIAVEDLKPRMVPGGLPATYFLDLTGEEYSWLTYLNEDANTTPMTLDSSEGHLGIMFLAGLYEATVAADHVYLVWLDASTGTRHTVAEWSHK